MIKLFRSLPTKEFILLRIRYNKAFLFGKADRATKETVNDWTNQVLEVYKQMEVQDALV